jgi:hypothetical protein
MLQLTPHVTQRLQRLVAVASGNHDDGCLVHAYKVLDNWQTQSFCGGIYQHELFIGPAFSDGSAKFFFQVLRKYNFLSLHNEDKGKTKIPNSQTIGKESKKERFF